MALTKITSNVVKDDAVTSAKIVDGGIATADIAANAVTSAKIAQNSILTKHIDDGQVTTDQLGADAVTSAKIADDAISEEHLDVTVITGLTEVTAATGDLLMVADISDSNNLKKIPVSSILAGTHTGAINTSSTIASGAIQIGDSLGSGYGITVDPNTQYGAIVQTTESTPSANANLWCRIDDDGTVSTLFRVQNDGNVGINTSTPLKQLHVYQPSGETGILLSRGNNITGVNLQLSVDSSKARILGYGADGLTFWTNTAGNGTNAGERVRITPGGNVGIGQSDPDNHINTGNYFKPDSSGRLLTLNGGSSGSFLLLESSTTTDNDQIGGVFFTRTGAQGDAHKQIAGIDVIQDTYAPNDILEGGTLRFFTKPSGSGTDNPRMIINGSGDVGIGTSVPTGLLEINSQLSAASTVDYPLVISSRDDANSINQLGGEGVGIKFRLAGNSASTPGDSIVGASIAAMRESSSDAVSDTGLAFFISQDDETLDEALRINHDGNVGIGCLPDAWSGYSVLQLGNGGALAASEDVTFLSANGYSSSTGWRYATTDEATLYQQQGGEHIWLEAASGSADGLITWSESMRLDTNGFLGIGINNPLDLLHINSDSTDARVVIDGHTDYDAEVKFAENGTVKYTIGHDAATDSFVIGTTNVDTGKRLEIDSSGHVKIHQSLEIVTSNAAEIQMTGSGAGNLVAANDLYIMAGSGTSSGNLYLGSEGSNAQVILDGGQLGVGAGPRSNLYVKGTSASSYTGNGPGATIRAAQGTDGNWIASDVDGKFAYFGVDGNDGKFAAYNYASTAEMGLILGQSRMYIKNDGKVGIATTDPTCKLQVNGALTLVNGHGDFGTHTYSSYASIVGNGEIQFTVGYSGTLTASRNFVFTYQATSWKAWGCEIEMASTEGLACWKVGGYNNNSAGHNSYENNDQNSMASLTYTTSGQQNIITLGFDRTHIHPCFKVKYWQSGGDGAPRMDRVKVEIT